MRKKQKFEDHTCDSDDSRFSDRRLRSKSRKKSRFNVELNDVNKANDSKCHEIDELTDECNSEIDAFSDTTNDNLNDPDYGHRSSKSEHQKRSLQCLSKLFIHQIDYESYEFLELPPSASDLLLRSQSLWCAVGVYEVLYHFSVVLRLSPFRFENFCAALLVKENTKLMTECHMSLLKCILKEDDQSGIMLTSKDCKDSVSISFYCLDDMTWYEIVCMYLESISRRNITNSYNSHHYYCLTIDQKLTLLQTLIDLFLCTNLARDVLFKENDLVHEEHCRSCHKRGNLLCCESCPAMYHLACIDPPLETIPSGDWYCLACHKHKMAEIEDANCISMRNQLSSGRKEPLGHDRHGRKYWHLCRRIFVEDDNELLAYYSTEAQLEELLLKFDKNGPERTLVESFGMFRNDILNDMKVTESLTEKFKDSKKTCLSQDDEQVNLRRTNQVNVIFDESPPANQVDTNSKSNSAKTVQNSQSISNPWISEKLFKLGMEGSFRSYSNVYSTEILALSRSQQVDEREKKRHLSYKFSLTPVAEFNWICGKSIGKLGINGGHEAMLEILRKTIVNLQESIPKPFMHVNWTLHSSKWLKAISKCTTAREFSLVLMIFEACIRPMVFNSVWHQALGHSTLQRITAAEIEEGKKREKEVRGALKEELAWNPGGVKYSLGVQHSVWKQKGEEYRITGQHSWYWVSPVRGSRVPKRRPKQSLFFHSNGSMEELTPHTKFLNGLLKRRVQMEEQVNGLVKNVKELFEDAQYLKASQVSDKTTFENALKGCNREQEDEKLGEVNIETKNDTQTEENLNIEAISQSSLNVIITKVEEALKSKSVTSDLTNTLSMVHSCRLRVSLKKFLSSRKNKNLNGGLPMAHYFEVRKQKQRTSIFVLDKEKLCKLARRAGTVEVPGFIYSSSGSYCPHVERALNDIYCKTSRYVGCPRANFQTAWRFRTRMASNLSCLALQLRVLHSCIRWDDMYMPYPSNGILVVDGAEHGTDDVTTYEMLDKRVMTSKYDPISYKVEYLVRKKVTPKESIQPLPPSSGERTTQRTGLRERRVVEPVVSEELMPEEEMELWQIKYFADVNEKQMDEKIPTDRKLQRVTSSMPSSSKTSPRPQTPTSTINHVSAAANHKPSIQTQSKQKVSLPGHNASISSTSSKISIEDELKRKRLEMQQKRFESASNSPSNVHSQVKELPIKILQSDKSESKSGLCVNELLKHISVVKGPDGKLQVLGLKEGQEAVHLPGGRIKIILSPTHSSNKSLSDEVVKTSTVDGSLKRFKTSESKQPEMQEYQEVSSNIGAYQQEAPEDKKCELQADKLDSNPCRESLVQNCSDREGQKLAKTEIDCENSQVELAEQTTKILAGLKNAFQKKILVSNFRFQHKDYKPSNNDNKETQMMSSSAETNGIFAPESLPQFESNGSDVDFQKNGNKKDGKFSSEITKLSSNLSPEMKPVLSSTSPNSSSLTSQQDATHRPIITVGRFSPTNVVTKRMTLFESPNANEYMKNVDEEYINMQEAAKQCKKRKRDSSGDLQLGSKKLVKLEKSPNGDESGKEEDAKLHCLCRTPYDNSKFYVGCNNCGGWYHGICVGLTPEAAALRDKYICELCRQHPSNQLHCICRTPYDETRFYIGCDECFGWFHGECVGVLALEAQKLESFKCPACKSRSSKSEEPSLKEEHSLKLLQLLKELKDLPISQAFLDDSIQKNKRGFNFIEEKLLIRSYKKIEEFIEDFEGFFSDLRYYSLKQSIDYKNANKLQSMFLSKLIKLRKRL